MSETKPKSAPRDVFLYLALLLSLYVSAFTFVGLMFTYIDYWMQDPLYRSYSFASEIRWMLSVLLVVVPAFLVISWIVNRDLVKNPEHAELRVRKWVLSFTLFTSAGTAVGDLIYLIHNLLSGELTTSFVLKSLTLLAVAGSTFGYYLWDLKNPVSRMTHMKAAPGFVMSVALVSIITGFSIVGSPGYERAQRLDEQRIYELRDLDRLIQSYYEEKSALPAHLEEINTNFSGQRLPRDPETKAPFEYKVLTQTSFELCANFKTKPAQGSWFSENDSNWKYVPGKMCFTRQAETRKGNR